MLTEGNDYQILVAATSGMFEVKHRVSLYDITTNRRLIDSEDPNLARNSHLINRSMLSTGHTYMFVVEEKIGGWNFVSDNRKLSFTTFTVR